MGNYGVCCRTSTHGEAWDHDCHNMTYGHDNWTNGLCEPTKQTEVPWDEENTGTVESSNSVVW